MGTLFSYPIAWFAALLRPTPDEERLVVLLSNSGEMQQNIQQCSVFIGSEDSLLYLEMHWI